MNGTSSTIERRNQRISVRLRLMLSTRSQSDDGKVFRTAAQTYKVDTEAIALKVKQEFAAKDKARKTVKTGKRAA